MAVQTQEKKYTIVGKMIDKAIEGFVAQRDKIRDVQDSRFAQRVIDEGLSYQDQRAYYRDLLAAEKASSMPDESYILKLNDKITAYNKLVRAQNFTDKFRNSYRELLANNESIDQHIDFLKSQLADSPDVELASIINTKLDQAYKLKQTNNDQITTNNVNYALKDKTEPILSKMISEVKNKIATAKNVGDDNYVSSLSVSLQALNKQLNQTQLEKQARQNEADNAKNPGPINKMSNYNRMISMADDSTPITVNGKDYSSVKQYWETAKGDYLSSGGFFQDLNNFYTNKINGAYAQAPEVMQPLLKTVKSDIDSLIKQPDFADYQNQLKETGDIIFATGVNYAANDIINKANTNYNFGAAVDNFKNLKDSTGVDVSRYYDKLISDVTKRNVAQATQISQNMDYYKTNINKSATAEEALAWAVKATPQPVSPAEAAGKSGAEIVKDTGADVPEKKTIIPAEPIKIEPVKFNEGELVKEKNSPTVYKIEGGVARPFMGAWDEDVFKAQAGKGFSDVKQIDSLSGINKGKEIIKQQATLYHPTDRSEEHTSELQSP